MEGLSCCSLVPTSWNLQSASDTIAQANLLIEQHANAKATHIAPADFASAVTNISATIHSEDLGNSWLLPRLN